MQSISGKKVCPSGEQITNGGFETGDLTGFTTTGTVVISSWSPHTGTYDCLLDDYPSLPSIEQDILAIKGYSISVKCISSMTLWARLDTGNGDFTVLITYSDGSTTTIPLNTILLTYEQFDLLPYLDTSKSVSKINISLPATGMSFKIFFDDISLIGKG